MKICLINNLYKPYKRGGAEIIFENIVDGLKKKGHDVFVITSKSITIPIKNFEYNTKVYHLKAWNIISYNNLSKIPKVLRLFWHIVDMFDICNYWRVKSILKKEKPDLVMTHNLKGIGYLVPKAIKKLKIKHLHTLHDIQLIHPSGLMIFKKEKIINNTLSKIYSNICSKLINSPDVIISPSRWLLNLHIKKNFFKKSKKLIIPNPINNNVSISEKKYPSSTFKFLYIGLIEPQKGIDVMIKAFQGLCDECLGDKCELNLIGDGPGLEKYKKKYKTKNNIKFLGRLENKIALEQLSGSNALIVPSICYENSPTVIYEATSTNTPIIASRIGGITELIHELGGLLFTPNNKGDLMYQMKWLIENYDKIINNQKKQRKRIKKYNIENYINKILKI